MRTSEWIPVCKFEACTGSKYLEECVDGVSMCTCV